MASSQINILEEVNISYFHTQGHGVDEEPWLFGEPLPPSVKMNSHDRIEVDEFQQGITDSEMEDAAAQVESRLTVMSVADDGAEQISVHTRPVHGRVGGGTDGEGMDDEYSQM